MTRPMTRRDGLLTALFGTGYIGLRALATGLPAWFLLNPRSASAQSLQCAITSTANLQYLILSTSSMGDPLNCNCPGTYDGTTAAASAIHPQQAEVAATSLSLGSQTYQAALPWVPAAGGVTTGQPLAASVLARTCFFHHTTGTTVHGDQPKVMKLIGDINGGEMLVSAIAKHLSGCFGTVQAAPVSIGAGSNASEFVSYSGSTLPSISPMQLKQLLAASTNNPLVNLRSIRDTSLNALNALAKSDGNVVQQQFLDALATSQTQVRTLSDQLATTLNAIKDNTVTGQALAAAALIAANVTPCVTMHIPFGGDNHVDQNLQAEADQTVSGVAGIQLVMNALSSLSLTDKVTFATLNVFGRNLNNTSTSMSRSGRDHYGNHCVTVMIGKNVAPSVIGGLALDSTGSCEATGIDSSSGAPDPSGDITADMSHDACARTLGAALGIPASVMNNDFISTAGGAVVPAAVVTVP
jgi:hypothetical protein